MLVSIGIILRESIAQGCGQEGVEKFFSAGYTENAFMWEDGTPDLQGLINALLLVFPPEKASLIAGDFGKRLRDITLRNAEENRDDVFVRYFNAHPEEVRSVILEARRVREAMGKEMVDYGHEELKHEAIDPIEKEIVDFVYGRTKFSSLDIMDFIRHLKDKGFSFQESIILQKTYEKIEGRKKDEKFKLESIISGFLNENPSPTDSEILKLVEKLANEGYVYDRHDIKGMVRTAIHRRH